MQETILFDVHDLKVYPLTDPTTPTYGAPVDVPLVSQIGLDEQVVESILRGDGRIGDQRTVIEAVTASFTYGKLAPDVLAVLDGGTVSDNGADTVRRYVRTATDKVPYFGLSCLISEVDDPAGAAKLYLYKAKITGGTLFGGQSQNHGQPTFDVRAIALDDDAAVNPIWAVDLEDVGTALPADSAALVATYAALV